MRSDSSMRSFTGSGSLGNRSGMCSCSVTPNEMRKPALCAAMTICSIVGLDFEVFLRLIFISKWALAEVFEDGASQGRAFVILPLNRVVKRDNPVAFAFVF